VLDAVPEKAQAEVKAALQQIASAPTRDDAGRRQRAFRRNYHQRFPKAVERLERNWERMVTYYDFPEAHWRHLRTTNVIESPLAAVRLRTSAAKRFKRVDHATALIWKLLLVAEQHFRKLNRPELCEQVHKGTVFSDGVLVPPTRKLRAA
jgi:transposase-like protein